MSKKGFSVRKLESLDNKKEWIDSVLGQEKETSSSGGKTRGRKPRGTQPSRSRKHLIPSECDLPIKVSRINDIFLELRDNLVLDGKKSTPNAVAVLFRVFLEVSLDKYINVANVALSKEPKIKERINKVAKDTKDKKTCHGQATAGNPRYGCRIRHQYLKHTVAS